MKHFFLLLSILVLAACSEEPKDSVRTIKVNGTVSFVDGAPAEGTLNFRVFHLWFLQDEFRHSLAEIADFQSETPDYTGSFEYNETKGDGVAILAWLDTDNDGVFCTPTNRNDPSGLAWVEKAPDDSLQLDIVLTENCKAETFFFPPK